MNLISEQQPKASICVVTYNQEKYIEQCLISIVEQQTSFPFDVIVSDDCSTDGTRDIIKRIARHHSRIRLILQPANIGMVQNYRAVHGAASAEFTCHCDGDDFWHSGKLEAQVKFLENNPTCTAVFTNANVVAENGSFLGIFNSGVPTMFDANFLIRRGNFLNHSSMMYRTAVRKNIFPERAEFIDFEIYLGLCRQGCIGYIDKQFVSYRDQSYGSTIRTDNSKIRLLYWQALCEADDRLATPDAIREAKAHFLAAAMQRELLHGSISGYRRWSDLVQNTSTGSFAKIFAQAFYLTLLAAGRRLLNRLYSSSSATTHQTRVFHRR